MNDASPAADAGILRSVGRRIRQLREERGWSRRELCEHCGLSQRFLAQVESGSGNPSLRSLAGIAAALEIPPATLLMPVVETVALLGLRGAGKSTVGRALAERLGWPFVELDARVEEAAGLSLAQIFELHGEAAYRQVEREVLARLLSDPRRTVVATGGGIVTDPASFDLLRRSAITVWLKARPEVHWDRVVAQGDRRPMADDPGSMERLRRLFAEREPLYRQARHVVDVSDAGVEEVVERILPFLGGSREGEEASAP